MLLQPHEYFPSLTKRWLFALKLAGWPKVLVPAGFGQLLGFAALSPSSSGSMGALFLGILLTVVHTIFIVCLNDWSDWQVDTIKRQMFPEQCSLKTIPDGILPRLWLARMGILAGAVTIALGWAGAWFLQRPCLGFLVLGQVVFFLSYSLPPIRLNYRGGGEFLEAFGVGALLPLTHAYLQSNFLWHDLYIWLLVPLLLSAASALASGLSDERSDRLGGKTTFATCLGNQPVAHGVVWLLWVAVLVLCSLGLGTSWWVGVVPAMLLGVFTCLASPVAKNCRSDAFTIHHRLKELVHYGSWYSLILLGALLSFQARL